MEIISLLLIPVVLVSFIWLLIVGFKKSIGWGFLLLVGPLLVFILSAFVIKPNSIVSILFVSLLGYIPALAFAYKNWADVQKPFLIFFIASSLMLTFSLTTLSKIADNSLEQLISQSQQGQLNPEDAAKQMRKIIQQLEDGSSISEQDKLIIKTAKNIITQVEANLASDPDYYNKSLNQSYQNDLQKLEEQRKREAKLKKLEERLNKRKEVENKPIVKKQVNYPVIKKSEVNQYLGSKVIVVSSKNIQHKGLLTGFDEETYSLILEIERKTGKLQFKMHMSDVKTIYLYLEE